jgi:hypothetical protein
MSRVAQDAGDSLWSEGQAITLVFNRTSPTTATVTWNAPQPSAVVTTTKPVTYNGMLITASQLEINPSNYPTDGVIYTPSADVSTPADRIGQALVVGAFYNDKTTNSLKLTNLDPQAVYYCSAHLISNVNTYYSLGVRSYPESTVSGVYASDIPKSYGPPENPTMGQCYFDEQQNMLFSWNGATWIASTEQTTIAAETDPQYPWTGMPTNYPRVGDFFYNTRTKLLKVWSGVYWRPVESDGGGPIYKKQGVGTDLTNGARLSLINSLKMQLGFPVVCVELTDAHFNIAVDKALAEIRRRVDNGYNKRFFFTQMMPGQSTYYLNDPTSGTNTIVDVIRIHRLNMLGLVNFGPDNIYAQAFMSQFYAPGVGYDLVSIHLISAMSETYSQIFAGEIAYNWNETSRQMEIYRNFVSPEKVLVEATCEKMEQELIADRWTSQWIQQWAKSEAMFMLAQIRGKFASLPGPGGGLQLNADTLMSEAQRLQEDCLRQVQDFEVGQNGPGTFFAPFVIG